MSVHDRIDMWSKLAAEIVSKANILPKITVSSIPTYKASLFSIKPEVIIDIEDVLNVLNKYIDSLSRGKLKFSHTWEAPSTGASEFTSSLKNIYSLSKWIYGIVSSNQKPYSVNDFRQIFNDLKSRALNMDFPEQKATNFKSEITNICQVAINKLGTSK